MRLLQGSGEALKAWREREAGDAGAVEARVREIIEAVRREGDTALFRYTRELDRAELDEGSLKVKEEEIDAAYDAMDKGLLSSLRAARANILDFHEKQKRNSWLEPDSHGNLVGQLLRPLERVGVYAPGGTAVYPSSVLMNVLPARAAGVQKVALATPPRPDGSLDPIVLVAAREAGADEIYRMGGAQAVAALAYGTALVQRVDKITGPGNVYVTAAKRLVYGQVDIDMLAGPSEIVVVADDSIDPRYLAADLLSQAEHDPRATAWLLTPFSALARQVGEEVDRQLTTLPRREIASRSIKERGAAVLVRDLVEAIELAGLLAPEHLELAVAEPFTWLGRVKNAGAIFLGACAPEPVGDYYAGPNHVLPTGGTARFFSPLSVDDFLKKTSVIYYTRDGLRAGAGHITALARAEGLEAHARAVEIRFDGNGVSK